MAEIQCGILDHLIYLYPPGQLDLGVERFKALGFNVIRGGTHADGLTHNALIILPDGVYVEIIAFVHEVSYYSPGSEERRARETHWWANKKPGWIDWCNLAVDPATGGSINTRAGRRIYSEPQEGGRQRTDGEILKWRVTFPEKEFGRGVVPFYCEDLTPRSLRVPVVPQSYSQHSNGCQGIAKLRFNLKPDLTEDVINLLRSIMGQGPPTSPEADTELTWKLLTPNALASDSTNFIIPSLEVITASTDDYGVNAPTSEPPDGLAEVVFRTSGNSNGELVVSSSQR